MQDNFELNQSASIALGKSGRIGTGNKTPSVGNPLKLHGFYNVEHWRYGSHMATYQCPNGIVNEGKNSIFDVYFDADTQITTWYMLLIDLAGFSSLAATDTYDDIDQGGNGWDEFKLYDVTIGGTTTDRGTWVPDPASGQAISNSSQVIFDITGTATVKGLAMVGGGAASITKGDHASDGTLWSTALFDQGDTAVINGDQLKITYTTSA